MSPPSESTPPRVGRYEIRREIGRGMMGVVYEAFDPALGRAIALKVIHLAFPVTPEENAAFEQRFLSEARIAGRLSHPGIVVVHDAGRDADTGTLFIAMEYLEGRTLSQSSPEPPLDWREVLHVGARLAEALHHAHAGGVIHRDIKPANIMILASGDPKIMDFGIAKVETARMKLTATGQSFGTPLYMSPEQALGHDVDPRTDLFSLGAILYWLLTGRLAFGAESMMAIIGKVLHQDPAPPSTLRPDLPPDADYVIARALAKAPADRYPSGGTMAEDIGDVLAGHAPRHRARWSGARPPLMALNVPAGAAPAPSAAAKVEGTARSSAPPRPERTATLHERWPSRPHRLPRILAGAVGVILLVGTAGTLLLSRRSRTATATPAPAAEAAAETSPSASPPSGLGGLLSAWQGEKPAQLAVDLEHPLRSATLRIWVDGELAKEERVAGRITKKVIGLTLRKGVFHDVIEVKPGRHEIQVQVAWDDGERTQRISGTFKPDTARRLDVTLGRVLKDLTVEWK
ncbi:MAG TPA: serine/threonine-protein kinase [Vicinamibacteria bacterium]